MENGQNKKKTSSVLSADFSLDRIRKIITALEQELALAPPDSSVAISLQKEISSIKKMIEDENNSVNEIEKRIHNLNENIKNISAKIEGELLRDSAYLAEIGRILGLL